MGDSKKDLFYRDPRPAPSPEEKARRRAEREAAAAVAMAEHDERERLKYANMERLKAERLAKNGA